jgi:hypothetical protein
VAYQYLYVETRNLASFPLLRTVRLILGDVGLQLYQPQVLIKSHGGYCQTIPNVNAHVKNPASEDLTEIKVTESMHQLLGWQFAIAINALEATLNQLRSSILDKSRTCVFERSIKMPNQKSL